MSVKSKKYCIFVGEKKYKLMIIPNMTKNEIWDIIFCKQVSAVSGMF